jgi:predicted RNA binding protein YcfA (HicA-like mRNA interferase family)
MTKLGELKYEEVVRKIHKLGFSFYRKGKGSHELWVRNLDGKVIPIPRHKGKSLRKGTLRAIIKEIAISVEEFMEL